MHGGGPEIDRVRKMIEERSLFSAEQGEGVKNIDKAD